MFRFTTSLNKIILLLSLSFYSLLSYAADTTGISDIDDMVNAGQSILKVAAKWGGILTVVGAALALGSGRLQGSLAQTVCKVLIVIGLLMASYTYFGQKISWGFSF